MPAPPRSRFVETGVAQHALAKVVAQDLELLHEQDQGRQRGDRARHAHARHELPVGTPLSHPATAPCQQHQGRRLSKFYGIDGLDAQIAYVLGALELVLLLAFVAGVARRWSYGIVLVLHGVSTLSSWSQYLHPFERANLLFFAAWPMLAACAALYLLRDADIYTLRTGRIAK